MRVAKGRTTFRGVGVRYSYPSWGSLEELLADLKHTEDCVDEKMIVNAVNLVSKRRAGDAAIRAYITTGKSQQD